MLIKKQNQGSMQKCKFTCHRQPACNMRTLRYATVKQWDFQRLHSLRYSNTLQHLQRHNIAQTVPDLHLVQACEAQNQIVQDIIIPEQWKCSGSWFRLLWTHILIEFSAGVF